MPYHLRLTECMLEQSTMVGQVKRGFGEHFSVNVDGESEICEESFSSVYFTYFTYTLGVQIVKLCYISPVYIQG